MGTSVKEESTGEEAFSLGESSHTWELSPHGRSMRTRRDGSSEASSGEEVQDRREGEAAPLCELSVS